MLFIIVIIQLNSELAAQGYSAETWRRFLDVGLAKLIWHPLIMISELQVRPCTAFWGYGSSSGFYLLLVVRFLRM